MSECTHNCSTCGESCGERTSPQSFLKKPHADAHIGKVFGVVSGKGGVGKSMVTSQLAVSLRRKGYRVGILDADITGPSIPKAFGMHEKAVGTENALLPCVSSTGIEVMSINLLLDDETDPVIWRGPISLCGLGVVAITTAWLFQIPVKRLSANILFQEKRRKRSLWICRVLCSGKNCMHHSNLRWRNRFTHRFC